jgi:hypothetical protein
MSRTIFGLPVDALAASSSSWVNIGFNPGDYVLKVGDTMTGSLDMENNASINIATGGSLTTPSAVIGSLGLVSGGMIAAGTNSISGGALAVGSITASGTVSCGSNALTCGPITSSGTVTCGTNALTSGAVSCGAISSSGPFDNALNPIRTGGITCRDSEEFVAIETLVPNAVNWGTATSGFSFVPTVPIYITSVGFVDGLLDAGFGATRDLGIWRQTDGIQLLSATVNLTSPTASGYLKTPCTPLSLLQGVVYVIGMSFIATDDFADQKNMATQVPNELVTNVTPLWSSSAFAMPNLTPIGDDGPNRTYGVNFWAQGIVFSTLQGDFVTCGDHPLFCGPLNVNGTITSNESVTAPVVTGTTVNAGNLQAVSLFASGSTELQDVSCTTLTPGPILADCNPITSGTLTVQGPVDGLSGLAMTYTSSTNQQPNNVFTMGFRFTPTQDLVAGALGFYSSLINTAQGTSRPIGIWRVSDQKLMLSTTITTSQTISGGYRQAPISTNPPIIFHNGVEYVIGIEVRGDATPANADSINVAALTPDGAVSFVAPYQSDPGMTFGYPGTPAPGPINYANQTYGVNFWFRTMADRFSVASDGSGAEIDCPLAAASITGTVMSLSQQPLLIQQSSGVQSLSNNTITLVTNATVLVASLGDVTYSAGDWTLASPGFYLLSSGCQFASNGTGNRMVYWENKTTNAHYGQVQIGTNPAGVCSFSCTAMVYSAGGDTYQLYAYQNGGGTLNFNDSTIQTLVTRLF